MLRRIFNRYNFIPLLLIPVVMWGGDLIVHMLAKWISNPKIWITFLSVAFPLLGYFLVQQIYERLSGKMSDMLLPEIVGIVGLLYSQPIYMVVAKLVFEGSNSISFNEAAKTILVLTPVVPVSTIMISTYDGSLLAVSLAILSMIYAGRRCRRKNNPKT